MSHAKDAENAKVKQPMIQRECEAALRQSGFQPVSQNLFASFAAFA